MPRLRRADCSKPGITRRRRGRGWEYFHADGTKITDPEVVQRLNDLVLPPAWSDVWICPWPNGHLQAVGTDAAGRKQYRYHDEWRRRRDLEKFDEMLSFARTLPALREVCRRHLAEQGLHRDRVLACAVRLLDHGFFRIGTEEGLSRGEPTYGLTTMRKEHAAVRGQEVTFDYVAKGGKRRIASVVDAEVADVVGRLKRRRGGSPELLAWKEGSAWVDVTAGHVNEWIKQHTGGDYSAKDFRTWNATVLAAVALGVSARAASSPSASQRAKARACAEVAHYLGNTPTVARSSYIDPRLFDRYDSGWVVAVDRVPLSVDGGSSLQGAIEQAVLDLLEDRRESDSLEHTDAA